MVLDHALHIEFFNGVIAVEKLNVKNMLGNHCLAKSISDASWSMFRSVLTAKAENAGREVIAIDPRYTSQDCHACGFRAKKKLSERWHHCPMCSASLDRDTNAAINILNLAINHGGITVSGRACRSPAIYGWGVITVSGWIKGYVLVGQKATWRVGEDVTSFPRRLGMAKCYGRLSCDSPI
jgi:IS605 OrfB family transposase